MADRSWEGDIIAFAERVLNLLDQGSFVATYKYAVLLGLMDLCLEKTMKDGLAPYMVTTRELALKVIDLYWPQTVDFRGDVLKQNSGRQARILSDILVFRESLPDPSLTLVKARYQKPQKFERLVRQVEWTLILMPLPRLQFVGSEMDPVIYQIGWNLEIKKGIVAEYQRTGAGPFNNAIQLLPGVGDWLVRLNGLLRPIVHRQWAAMVAQLNKLDESRLETFLFGADRTTLTAVRPGLVELQNNRCFYCGGRLSGHVEVDHFIPWSRYPENGVGNLVVADPRCNSSKRDFLAAVEHLGRWTERNLRFESDIHLIARKAQAEPNIERCLGVARGFYLRLAAGTPLWLKEKNFSRAEPERLRAALFQAD